MKAAIKRLENGSIALLPLDVAHASEYIRLANEQTIAEAVNNPLPYERHHFDGLREQISKNPRLFVWMIASDGIICGAINSSAMRSPQVFQGGYWLEPQFRGNGIGAKAQMLVRNFLVNECNAIRIQALVEPSNLPSIRVLEQCDFIHEGLLRRSYPTLRRGLIDVRMYAYIAQENDGTL